MQWHLPTEPQHRRQLDAACEAVGPPSIVVPAGVSTPVADRVAVISWNIHVGAGDVPRLVANLRNGAFTGGLPIDHFVLLLQEAFRSGSEVPAVTRPGFRPPRSLPAPGGAHEIRAVAQTVGASLVYVPSMRNAAGQQDRGNAILSTLPIGDIKVIELPFERQRRAAISATVSATTTAGVAWKLTVASVHFDTAVAWTRGGPGAARVRQAHAIIEVLSDPTLPLIVGGDLNTWWGDDEPAVRAMRRAFGDASPIRDLHTWSGPLGFGGKLDHLFSRTAGRRLDVRRIPDRMGSDHYPLMTMFAPGPS